MQYSPVDIFSFNNNIGILLFGMLLGMRHALESDHVAAVSTLVTRSQSSREIVWMGIFWGIGHTFTLFIVGSTLLLVHAEFPEHVAWVLEFSVGIMLVILGFDVIRRMILNHIHIHFHSHASEEKHEDMFAHRHSHKRVILLRPFIIGTVHGMAGSAALLLLTLQTLKSPLEGVVYIFMFGL